MGESGSEPMAYEVLHSCTGCRIRSIPPCGKANGILARVAVWPGCNPCSLGGIRPVASIVR